MRFFPILRVVSVLAFSCLITEAIASSHPIKVPPLTFLEEGDVAGLQEDSRFHPPAPDSPEDRNDLLVSREKEKSRTSSDCERVVMEQTGEIEKNFVGILQKNEALALAPCLNYGTPFSKDVSHYVDRIKNKYLRKRPFERPGQTPPIKVCQGMDSSKTKGSSFPSGHSALAAAQATILGQLFPDRKSELMKRAETLAMNRVVLGVHYRSDVLAGGEVGMRVGSALQKSKSFSDYLQNKCAAHLVDRR